MSDSQSIASLRRGTTIVPSDTFRIMERASSPPWIWISACQQCLANIIIGKYINCKKCLACFCSACHSTHPSKCKSPDFTPLNSDPRLIITQAQLWLIKHNIKLCILIQALLDGRFLDHVARITITRSKDTFMIKKASLVQMKELDKGLVRQLMMKQKNNVYAFGVVMLGDISMVMHYEIKDLNLGYFESVEYYIDAIHSLLLDVEE